ncbi:hypothetical protein [Formosa haliotis]|uniref:hypothetical protein n=1 Tax=Formosa haliotis TaxID=1555194 RepID=UPI000A5A291D|nr:hypothetical protein [Formosa haliotis]
MTHQKRQTKLGKRLEFLFSKVILVPLVVLLQSQSMSTVLLSDYHSVPESIQEEAKLAFSFYPELAEVSIAIRFKKDIKKSTMQAQPEFKSLFKNRKKRRYVIFISKKIKITGSEFSTKHIPSEIIVGWLGHELGHVRDYQNRSAFGLIGFGFKYLFSDSYLREAERTADSYAISNGMEKYIIATKNFILDHANIPESYKNRMRKYYLSPEEIMILVEERDAKEASD